MTSDKINLLKFTILLISFQLFIYSAKPNNITHLNTDSIFYHIYNQQYPTAEIELNNVKNSFISYFLLETDLKWWKSLLANNDNDFENFENYLNDKLNVAKNHSNEPNFEELICLNYLLRLASVTKQHLKMMNYFFKLNNFIESFDSNSLSFDEKNIYSIYKAVFNISKNKIFLINAKNNIENIQVLKRFENSQNIVCKTFAHYFLAKIYMELEKKPQEAQKHYQKLNLLYPNNQFFQTSLTLLDEIKH